MKPFSTSALKVLTWIIATTTKIYTRDKFIQDHSKYFVFISTFILLVKSLEFDVYGKV